jgi:hypothetical protein
LRIDDWKKKKDKLLGITVNFLAMLFYCCHTPFLALLKNQTETAKRANPSQKLAQKAKNRGKHL